MRAYITLLSTKSFLPGVMALNRALKAVNAKHPLYCLLSTCISAEVESTLRCEGVAYIRLTRSAMNVLANPSGKSFSHWNYSFDKLFVFGLTQFEKVVFLDSDMLIVRNLDHLFDCAPFSAVAADHSFPGNGNWAGGLNSGLIVVEPDKAFEAKLLDTIPQVVKAKQVKQVLVGDQDVLHHCLPNWGTDASLHLDEGYNLFADHLTYYIRHFGYTLKECNKKPIYVIHFIGKSKPWMKKTLRERLWLWRMCLSNPYYVWAFLSYRKYLRNRL